MATLTTQKERRTLIWFDRDINNRSDTKEIQENLRDINDRVTFYDDLQSCLTYIQSITKDVKIFFIISDKQAREILLEIIHFDQIDSIFIYDLKIDDYQNLLDEYPKIVGKIYTNLTDLYKSIDEQIDLFDKQLQTLSFFDKHEQSTKDLSKQSGLFIWFQLFKFVILRLPNDQQAKDEMIETCRNYYRGNKLELNLIDEFEREYQSKDAIYWYSKQSFVYRLINKALRTNDFDQLYRFRYFISDLSKSLIDKHQQLLSSSDEQQHNIIVYRGAKLDKEEFEQLKQNQDKLISTNGYLSTSRDRSLALSFAKKSTKRPDIVPVLFEIQCDMKQLGETVIFADIEQLSAFPDEKEVLFDLDTAFRIVSIESNEQRQIIKMTVTNDAQHMAKHYIEQITEETEEKSVAIIFGRLMCDLGEYDKSIKYFEQLTNQEDPAWIQFNIGRALDFKGEYDLARQFYNRAYELMINHQPPRIKHSASVINNIGVTYDSQGNYNEALEYYQRALQIRENLYSSDHIDIADSLNNIGNILSKQEKYDEALEFHQRALKMKEKLYPLGHITIANSLNNIAIILRSQKNYKQALDYHQQALKIREKFYPSGHIDVATSLNNIGIILHAQCKYNEALEYYQRALEMKKNFYPSDHISITDCLLNISVCEDDMKQESYQQRSRVPVDDYTPARSRSAACSIL